MIFFWWLCVSLVLGGLAGVLVTLARRDDRSAHLIAVRVPARPRSAVRPALWKGLPPPHVRTRPGASPPGGA